jgi:hypothetical protein
LTKEKKKCFIIMPITTPNEVAEIYGGDRDHFKHVLKHLFEPAIIDAGFVPVPPSATGADIIQAEIIKQISEADLVLCDMSILNPNVFFEFGIRTALDKPVSLVVDNMTAKVPFDTHIIYHHEYDSSLDIWHIEKDIKEMSEHIGKCYKDNKDRNSLWKYFGNDKYDLLLKEIASLRRDRVNDTERAAKLLDEFLKVSDT